MAEAQCLTCGADWSSGRYGPDCAECGGGALARPCVLCGGRCGQTWTRAVMDSNDSGEAHWVGHCDLRRT